MRKADEGSQSRSHAHRPSGSWDELLAHDEFRWKQPMSCVQEFIEDLETHRAQQVCDLGCGAGRHTILLCRSRFDVYAMDNSPNALAHTRKWLQEEGLSATVRYCNLPEIPLPPSTVDAVIATNVIHHDTLANVNATVAEIYRVLRPGGLVLVTVLSKDDYRYGTGRQVEADTFIDVRGPEKGVLHHFFDNGSLRELFQAFTEYRPPSDFRSQYAFQDEKGQKWVGHILLGIFRKPS